MILRGYTYSYWTDDGGPWAAAAAVVGLWVASEEAAIDLWVVHLSSREGIV